MQERYQKNIGLGFSEELQELCLSKTVAVIGAGGVGGFLLEHLVRMGLKRILVFDGDVFGRSNLNRQRFCSEISIGQNKAIAATEALHGINEYADIIPISDFFSVRYKDLLLENQADMVFHCADYDTNVDELNFGISSCLFNRIPVIKTGVHADAVSSSLLLPGDPELWFSIKQASVRQAFAGEPLNIAALSHRCSLAACFAAEMYLRLLKEGAPSGSYSIAYNFQSMQPSLEP